VSSSISSATAHERVIGGVTLTVITPPRGWVPFDLRELWAYHELLYFLVWRDIKVRYKQTVLGVAWAVLQPVLMMIVFSLFLGRLAGIPSDGIPYPIFSFAGLVPWTLFSYGVTQSANSLVLDQQLVQKVYFPRMIIPTATVLAGVVDFGLAFGVLLAMMQYYGISLTPKALLLVPLLLLAVLTCLGVGLWLAALNVQYRDVRYTVPFLTQLWLFATPIAYPSSLVSEPWRALQGINPMAGVVEGLRWTLLGTPTMPGPIMAVSVLVALLLFLGGIAYFRRMEDTFADVI
jgi:lipopolysaccharide transport system permease protein